MTDDKKLKRAENVFQTLCGMLDALEIKYEKAEKDLVVNFYIKGEDVPMRFLMNIDADRELICLTSPIFVKFEGDKRLDGAIATCQANFRLADGSFDYDFSRGIVAYRMTSSYIESLISKDLFQYMLVIACRTVDEFNDKFMLLAAGKLPLEEFFKKN